MHLAVDQRGGDGPEARIGTGRCKIKYKMDSCVRGNKRRKLDTLVSDE